MDHLTTVNTGLSAVHWMDSSAVQLSSTHVAIEPMSTVKCWDRKQKKYVETNCPAIVKEYNEYMGSIDLFDMLMSLYKRNHKSCKWYRHIFFWVLNVAIVNEWILYRRHFIQREKPVKDQLDLLEFTASLSDRKNYLQSSLVRVQVSLLVLQYLLKVQ
mgnify:CR=1 FL=1